MRKILASGLLLLIFFSFLPFQACSGRVFFGGSNSTLSKSQMNGEGYSGKPTPYNFIDQNHQCADIGANGRPLPNSQIFFYQNGLIQLVRENCSDITPRTLAAQEYTLAADGTVIYQGRTYVGNFSSDPFEVVAATCPAGKTPLANPVRISLVREPLNLQAPMWETNGLSVSLVGSLASLPVYNVKRSDPNALESWRRMAQSAMLESGESYVYSFFVRPDTNEKAMFVSYYPNQQDLRIEFDLNSGTATTHSAVGAIVQSTKAQRFAGGLYINIYFQALNDVHANIGVASSGEFVGSSMSMTALQLEKISNFCSR